MRNMISPINNVLTKNITIVNALYGVEWTSVSAPLSPFRDDNGSKDRNVCMSKVS